jgi:surface carbohydrate biosynthesis protein (TIGR04326 family)
MESVLVSVVTYASLLAGPGVQSEQGAEPWTIWYFGDDYARLMRLRDMFSGKARIAPLGDALNRAAADLLPLMLDLEGSLAEPSLDRAAWDSSDVADRSRHNSPFFLEACRVAAFVAGASRAGRHLAVADDDGFALALFDAAQGNGMRPRWHSGSESYTRCCDRVKTILAIARRALSELRAGLRRIRILSRVRAQRPLQRDAVRAVDTWITTWATDRSFTKNAPLVREDRFGRLPELLRTGGLRLGYIVLPLWPDHFEEIAVSAADCSEPTLMVEDGIGIADVLRAVMESLLPMRGVRRELRWPGLNLSAVWCRALVRERLIGRSVQVRLFAGVPRLLESLGADPASFVLTYENHSWEKVLIAAMHRHLPRTRAIGYNHATCPPMYVSLNPGPGQIAAGSVPDQLLMMGEGDVEAMQARGFPKERLSAAGALRYEDFFERARQLPPPPPASVRTVICCVGVDLDEGFELVHKAAEAVAGVVELKLTVNFHPITGPEFRDALKSMVADRRPGGLAGIDFDDHPVRDLLAGAHAILYMDSNAVLEALAAGRQAIYVARDTGLSYDKAPPGLSQPCRTPEEIRRALLKPPARDADHVNAVLHSCIGPVQADILLSAVKRQAAA